MAKQRLQKVLAAAGVDSRRKCEDLIVSGVVRVNRKVVDELPVFVDPESDLITVHGKRVRSADKQYFLLNKPKGVICTNSDPQGRRKAIDMITTEARIFCVGRLDIDTTGAIVLTNDSELTNRLTHPRYELAKVYEVKVRGSVTGEAIEKLKKGIWLSEGKTEKSAVKIIHRTRTESIVQITIQQGLNRQIRRVMAKVGYKVKSMRRTKIGQLQLKGIGVGQYKRLTNSQIAYLMKATSMGTPPDEEKRRVAKKRKAANKRKVARKRAH